MTRSPGTPSTLRAVVASLGAAAAWSVLGFLVALGLLASQGQLQRYQVMSVLSGSMVPTMEVGDLVMARVVTPDHLRAGELATFRDPEDGRLVTHRVQSIMWRGEIADVVTRGDHNEVGENWSVAADDRVGEVVLILPRAGYALGVLGTRAGQLGLAGAGAVLGVWILVVIWRPQPPTDDAEPDEPELPVAVDALAGSAAAR